MPSLYDLQQNPPGATLSSAATTPAIVFTQNTTGSSHWGIGGSGIMWQEVDVGRVVVVNLVSLPEPEEDGLR